METPELTQFLRSVLEDLPSLLTLAACMIFVLTRWRRDPKIAFSALVGLVLLFFHTPFDALLFTFVWKELATGRNMNADSAANLSLILGVISNTAFAIAFTPLLVAIFIHRRSRTT